MALAQRQKYRSMEQNRKPEINPVFLRVFFPLSLGGFSYACVYQYSAEYSKGPFRHLWSSFLCSLLLFGFLPADLSRLCTPRFPTLSCIRLSHLFPISQRKPFFILKIALAIRGFLYFHTNLEIICSSSVKNVAGSLIGIALNL